MREFNTYFRKHLVAVSTASLAFGFKHSPVWAMPLVCAKIVDVLAKREPHDFSQVSPYIITLYLSILCNIPFEFLYRSRISKIVRGLEQDLREQLCIKVHKVPFSFFSNTSIGVIEAKIIGEITLFGSTVLRVVDTVLMGFFNFMAVIIITIMQSSELILAIIILAPISAFLVYVMQKPIKRYHLGVRKAQDVFASRVNAMVQLIRLTRSHGIEAHVLGMVVPTIVDVRKTSQDSDRKSAGFISCAWVVHMLFNVTILAITAWVFLHSQHAISIGKIVMIVTFFGMITGAILSVAGAIPDINKCADLLESLSDFLRSDEVSHQSGGMVATQSDVELQEVSFRYPGISEQILKSVDMRMRRGDLVAIVGASGSGKSTLVNLLMGLETPVSGKILIGGKSWSDLDPVRQRAKIGFVPQQPVLFHDSVRANIILGDPSLSDEKIVRIFHKIGAEALLSSLPQGLSTMIGGMESRLSGGEQQRIALVRALVRDPEILVLDEATSALDPESEASVHKLLSSTKHSRVTVFVTHRKSSVVKADLIYMLDAGSVAGFGNHFSLLETCAKYRALFGPASGPETEDIIKV